jgi:hypothetical protein
MTQIIIESGSINLQPLLDSTEVLVGATGYGIATLAPKDVGTMRYLETNDSLSSVARSLETGQISSVLITPSDPLFRLVFLHPPNACGQPLSLWHQVVEYRGKDFLGHVDSLAKIQGLRFISVSMEETIEITDAELTSGKFPWHKLNLILGASFPDERRESREIRAGAYREIPPEALEAVDRFVRTGGRP